MNMKDFNSKEYAWIDVTVVVLGVEVKAIRGVEYKTTRATEALYAAGKYARGIQRGRKEVSGTLTLLQSALIAMNDAANVAGFNDVTDIEFDMIVSYARASGGKITTDRIRQCAVTESVNSIKEGDLYSEHALPFIACEVEYGI